MRMNGLFLLSHKEQILFWMNWMVAVSYLKSLLKRLMKLFLLWFFFFFFWRLQSCQLCCFDVFVVSAVTSHISHHFAQIFFCLLVLFILSVCLLLLLLPPNKLMWTVVRDSDWVTVGKNMLMNFTSCKRKPRLACMFASRSFWITIMSLLLVCFTWDTEAPWKL